MNEIDPNALERIKTRQLRGSVLRILRAVFSQSGDGATFSLIASTLLVAGNHVREQELADALKYLTACELAECIEKRTDLGDRGPKTEWRLTPRGLHVVEYVASDPGVDLG